MKLKCLVCMHRVIEKYWLILHIYNRGQCIKEYILHDLTSGLSPIQILANEQCLM
jgi:hypothetical protein